MAPGFCPDPPPQVWVGGSSDASSAAPSNAEATLTERLNDIEHWIAARTVGWSGTHALDRILLRARAAAVEPTPPAPVFLDRNGTPCYEGDSVMRHLERDIWVVTSPCVIAANEWVLWKRKGA